MNPHDNNHPDFSAFVLDELDPAAAARMRGLIACSPEAREEYERVKRMVAALQAGASLPRRALSPRQRETVLAMSQKQSGAANTILFSGPRQRNPFFTSTAWKIAAAACLTIGAFIVGHQTASRLPSRAPLADAKGKVSARTGISGTSPVPDVVNPPLPTADKTIPEVAPLLASQTPPENNEMSAIPTTQTVAPVTSAMVEPVHSAKPSLKSFVITAMQAETSINLQPGLMRPVRSESREFAGIMLASPTMASIKPAVTAPVISHKAETQPPLVIHSWKAEIASCPWDSSRRLMRCVVQIPVDQAGIESNDAEYRLAVKFNPARVLGYRLVTEKHMPPGGSGNLATRFAWYEIIPAGGYSPTRETPATLGLMEMARSRDPKSSQTLRLVDRGLTWNEAREDFEFETAMIGFNLLLQGADNIGGLNYKLVLDLAEQSRGEDLQGERSKFIKTVEQAQMAAGL